MKKEEKIVFLEINLLEKFSDEDLTEELVKRAKLKKELAKQVLIKRELRDSNEL